MRLRLVLLSLLAAFFAVAAVWHPTDPDAIDLAARHAPASAAHLLGTDQLGRDVLSRLLAGAWRTALVVLLVNTIGYAFGGLFGIGAALAGGWREPAILRIAEWTILLPTLVVGLTVTVLFGLSPLSAGFALGFAGVGPLALFVHSLTKRIMGQPFFMAARALGLSNDRLIFRHILPNVTPLLLTRMGSEAGAAIVAYASLSFLGLGGDTSAPDWGAMLFDYRMFVFDDPWLLIWPGAAIFLSAALLNWSFDDDGA